MTKHELLELVRKRFPDHSIRNDPDSQQGIIVPAELIPELFAWLRDDPETGFDYLEFETCTDRPPDHLDLIYFLYSYTHKHRLGIKVKLPRTSPAVPTLSHLWANADWNEREIYDLFGVHFHGHPDQRRLMMPEDWEGHPLRKDYLHPNVVKRPD